MNLETKAKEIRRTVLEMIVNAGRGHIGGAFSCVEILVALYYGGILKYDPHNPKMADRDRLILSKGHACPTLYAILADLGYFDRKLLNEFCAEGSILEGHPNIQIPGIEASTGSLGHGLAIGNGMALAAKKDNANYNVFVILGDGECQEGSVWESANFAAHHKLNNLIAIVDDNHQCVLDHISESLAQKFLSFGWNVLTCNGHDIQDLIDYITITLPLALPTAIIARTVKGRGVSFMEGNLPYHHKLPVGRELEIARLELSCGT